jgi:hypothetical protein
MMSSKFLDYEVALLLAKYGKNALLAALAQKLKLTADELEEMLQASLHEKPSSAPRKKPSNAELIEQIAQEYPSKAQYLRALHARFENRSFLRELRDVKRFFEEHEHPVGGWKSRAESLPKLLRLLAELDNAELEAICQSQPDGTYSALGVIADEILRRNR